MHSGNYYLLVAGCGDISSENITNVVVKPKPNVMVTSDTICIGDTAIITASGANSYLWKPGNYTTALIKVTPIITTNNYKVIGTSLGCKDSTTTFVKVNPLPIITTISDSVCINDTATLIANGALSYLWSNGIASDTIRVSPLNDSTYKVVGTDINNCVDSTTANVVVYPLPIIQLTPNTTICKGSQATLTTSGGNNYLWRSTNETTSSIVVSPTDPITPYKVVVTSINNCVDSASVDISTIELPVPTISLTIDTLCKGAYTTITADGGTSYHWNTGEITPSIYVNPLKTIIYNVTVSTSSNNVICSKDIAIQQNVRNCNVIYVPNSFMPSGYNTVFKPLGEIVISKTYYFAIYNRWGQMVFETTDVNQGWDGRLKGEYVQSGAYIYYLRIDNGYEDPFEKIGTVTLIN